MITEQDIQEKTFSKASFGGYNMGEVDDFLDELAAEISAMAKENAALKSKMRVLVEKIEEYRQTEDSMRLALLSAQKMSAQIEADAKARAEALVTEAETKAASIASEIQADIANEQAKLAEAKKATQKYVDHMTTVCQKQVEFYEKLLDARLVSGPKAQAAAKEEEETVRSIESSVVKAALQEPEAPIRLDAEEEEPTRHFAAEAPRRRRAREDYRFEDDED